MNKVRGASEGGPIGHFFDELLLYSGQYALFYILMNFSRYGLGFFSNEGHTLLFLSFLAQTFALVRWGDAALPRFFISLLAPAAYAALEASEGLAFLLDMGHSFFWVFSILTAALQAASRVNAPRRQRMIYEFLITVVNVAAFFVVYIYFDIRLSAEETGADAATLERLLSIGNIKDGFGGFIADETHRYVLVGGLLLATTLAVGRVKILDLKERLDELFGQYVDPAFRDEIVAHGGGRPRVRELCVLFSDIRSFTSLSEKEEPASVSEMLNIYFTQWEELISLYGGSVDKYIGDAVMAVFGLRGGNPCDDAVSCARDMLRRMPRLRERLEQQGLPAPQAIGVGVDFGRVIVGDLGSKKRKNYTVIGDHVNVASRLESLCKDFRHPCIVSEGVAAQLSPANAARFEELGAVKLKGKQEDVQVWGLLE